jgi:preprotein translocase subunit SecD
MTGLVFLFYKNAPGSNKQGIYKVHYIVGSTQEISAGEAMLEEIPTAIKKRINDLGYNSVIRILQNKRLDILVDNVTDTSLLRQAVVQNTKTRKIEFREVYTLDELPDLFPAADKVSGKILVAAKRKEEGIYSIVSPLAPDEINGRNVFPAALGSVNKKDTVLLNLILNQPAVLQDLPADLQFHYGTLTDDNQILNTPDDLRLYGIKTRGQKALLQNTDIEKAEAEFDSYTGQPEIQIKFDNNGKAKWARMTNDNVDRYLAIILDDLVITAPRVNSPITGGRASLRGRFTREEAIALALQLEQGGLPAGLLIITEEIVSKSTSSRGNLILILSLTFVIATALGFLIFNSLKNR